MNTSLFWNGDQTDGFTEMFVQYFRSLPRSEDHRLRPAGNPQELESSRHSFGTSKDEGASMFRSVLRLIRGERFEHGKEISSIKGHE